VRTIIQPNPLLMQQTATIIRANEIPSYYFVEGCHVRELLNSPALPGISIAQISVTLGETTAWHVLDGLAEQYFILSGSGEMETDGQLLGSVSAGDLVHIPVSTSQRIRNTGPVELVFLSICTPRFEPTHYRHLS
jgi:quercetin dioxygenase-like cupin family protein